ncbi:MAG: phytanoyl-CoA dioxygenase family protein [Alphaproteobacteria bacterium]
MHELETPYPLNDEQIAYYKDNGYIKLKQVLSAEVLAEYGAEFTRVVRETPAEGFMPENHLALMPDGVRKMVEAVYAKAITQNPDETYARAFTQRANLWNISAKAAAFVFSKRLAKIAADLMEVDGVRLYHDQALYKEAQGGHTPWHCDQFYWPLSNDNTTTVWIPLQAVPSNMGPLAFAKGSHKLNDGPGRELAISDESEEVLGEMLKECETDNTPFDLGEVSFHAGWTYHRADPNQTDNTRGAFTIIYMDKDIRLKEAQHQNQMFDMAIWTPGLQAGDLAATPINPVLYER